MRGNGDVTFGGQTLTAEQLTLIMDCVSRYHALSLEELASTLCEWLDWRRPNGRLKTRECRDLLHALQARSVISLPALRAGRPRGSTTAIPNTPQGDMGDALACALSEVQPITLRRVERATGHALWRELVGRYHYLGHATAYGASVRYLIETSDQPSSPQRTLGCMQFSSPAWQMKARDHWIGWDHATRQQQLPRLINNSRFLILPWVRIPNLASHVLSLALRTATNDWEALYGVRPWLVETLVDSSRYSGHCYQAANWIDVGLTTGRGRQDRAHQRHGASPKRILLYPLCRNVRSRLQACHKQTSTEENNGRMIDP
tara:strand:- start:64 stop:1014 length:951 start_codon:yes stop_codon:yes gene_type:complete